MTRALPSRAIQALEQGDVAAGGGLCHARHHHRHVVELPAGKLELLLQPGSLGKRRLHLRHPELVGSLRQPLGCFLELSAVEALLHQVDDVRQEDIVPDPIRRHHDHVTRLDFKDFAVAMMGVVGASSPELLGEVEPMRLLLAFEHHAVQHVPVLVAGAEENEARVSEVEGAEFALVEHGQARGARALLAHHAVGDRERVEGARRAHVAFKALLRVLHQLSAVQACIDVHLRPATNAVSNSY
mmetsp:Transcript_31879/g.76105  ORF Transcript_31879/g.76105 Transcript_31879/m.76105 type:complete len:242 (+) Transcript_31879:107-832(+)|eukprot:CAMPEP_0177742776 /NCGR_PEP_ID=MMETSP0484_2-20121128/28845_1 /TAXON_ID=354590 /ORGANISM="Rhodomonas lens, Strain RHODO" /LENGTH=241 /DNA_ID=CAMNT_0019257139 /DNA_START=86 /DNA_END=811 /DNA_ORIENTATION=-